MTKLELVPYGEQKQNSEWVDCPYAGFTSQEYKSFFRGIEISLEFVRSWDEWNGKQEEYFWVEGFYNPDLEEIWQEFCRILKEQRGVKVLPERY
jgi:hypothetical protein